MGPAFVQFHSINILLSVFSANTTSTTKTVTSTHFDSKKRAACLRSSVKYRFCCYLAKGPS